jgi:flagellar biogenesis protein FliO
MSGELDVVQVMLRSALVIALIVPAMGLLRRLMGTGAMPAGRRHLRVVESRAIGTGQVLHLVKVGDRHLLIAAHKEGISMLSEVEIETADESVAEAPVWRSPTLDALSASLRDSRPGRWLAAQWMSAQSDRNHA